MASYIARTIPPSVTDKDYISTAYGGNNPCIEIKNGSCLPNCVGYCYGRWLEIIKGAHRLSKGNAEDWYANSGDGYKRGQKPEKGAIICWRNGRLWDESDGAGHIAVVERVKVNGDIVTSESAYGSDRFRTRTYTKKSGYYFAPGYELQGFIYIPVTFKLEKKKYSTGTYRVTAPSVVVRKGAGKIYGKKKNGALTFDARAQLEHLGAEGFDGYVKDMELTVTKVKGRWGRTPSGWVSLDHCERLG